MYQNRTARHKGQMKVCLQRIEYKLVRDRAINKNSKRISNSRDIYRLFKDLGDLEREEFLGIYLNSDNYIICVDTIAVGGVNSAQVTIRQVIKTALFTNAIGLITIHNHPSGNPSPSKSDDELTMQIKQACRLFEIKYLDHIIIGYKRYFSYADLGKIL